MSVQPYSEMRNFFFLLLTLSLFTFTACGDDDATMAELNQDNIVGDWNLTAFNNDASITLDGQPFGDVTSSIANSNAVVSFAADGTWSSTGMYDITIMTTDTTETETVTDGIGSGTYTVTATELSMTGIDAGDEADTETPTVFTVNNFQLNALLDLSGTASETTMDPFFNLTIGADVSTEMTLER